MSSLSLRSANTRISYNLDGSHIAKLRCKQLAISYSVQADETHSRQNRAFYPYQRVQGGFAMTFEFMGWPEYAEGMNWFRHYIAAMLARKTPSHMLVQMDSRNFVRLGYPTTGTAFGDHTASMVFSPTIVFVSVADPRDPRSAIKSLNREASRSDLSAAGTKQADWFYPESRLQHPGALDQYLHDQQQEEAAAKAAAVQDAAAGVLTPIINGGTGGPDRVI
jgi:hypothetical protein